MEFTVVFESIFGNTAQVGRAIAEGLGTHGEVSLAVAEDADATADLVVLGAPTHAHGLPTKMSRSGIEKEIAKRKADGEEISYQPTAGIRMFVDDLPRGSDGLAATFDTRFEKSAVLTGSAAKTMAKKLQRRGFELVAPPESFFGLDTEGPLKEGELVRARAWGESLAAHVKVPG